MPNHKTQRPASGLCHPGDPTIVDREVAWAIAHAPPAVREVLLEMTPRQVGKSRVDAIMYELDAGIRSPTASWDCPKKIKRAASE